MGLLNDQALAKAIGQARPLASEIDKNDIGRKSSQIQPTSLDLTIGKIHVPGKHPNILGGTNNPFVQSLSLEQGRTAVVVTKEKLNMPYHMAAIGFPLASVSSRGLLMTNPGHVDPGYKGHLSFTVINMGRKPYELRIGDRIVTLLVLSLDAPPSATYDKLKPVSTKLPPPVEEEVLERLSVDFMDVEERAKTIASRSVSKAQWTAPVISAALAALLTFAISMYKPWTASIDGATDRITKLESRLDSLGGQITLGGVEKRLKTIEQKLDIKTQN